MSFRQEVKINSFSITKRHNGENSGRQAWILRRSVFERKRGANSNENRGVSKIRLS